MHTRTYESIGKMLKGKSRKNIRDEIEGTSEKYLEIFGDEMLINVVQMDDLETFKTLVNRIHPDKESVQRLFVYSCASGSYDTAKHMMDNMGVDPMPNKGLPFRVTFNNYGEKRFRLLELMFDRVDENVLDAALLWNIRTGDEEGTEWLVKKGVRVTELHLEEAEEYGFPRIYQLLKGEPDWRAVQSFWEIGHYDNVFSIPKTRNEYDSEEANKFIDPTVNESITKYLKPKDKEEINDSLRSFNPLFADIYEYVTKQGYDEIEMDTYSTLEGTEQHEIDVFINQQNGQHHIEIVADKRSVNVRYTEPYSVFWSTAFGEREVKNLEHFKRMVDDILGMEYITESSDEDRENDLKRFKELVKKKAKAEDMKKRIEIGKEIAKLRNKWNFKPWE